MSTIVFNGRTITQPGAYDATDTSGLTVNSTSSVNIPIVIGQADSGTPGKLLWYSSASAVEDDLISGDLVTAAKLMFSPVPEGGGGVSTMGVIIVNNSTKATLTSGGLQLTATRYGEYGNQIQAKMEDGTIAGSKKITLYRWDTSNLEVFDNLGAVFKLTYTGSSAYAGVAVTVTNGQATQIQTKVGTDAGSAAVDVTVDLTNSRYATLEDVVSYFNSISGYTAEYVNYSRNADLSAVLLDSVSDVNIKSGAYLMALKGDIEKQLGDYSTLVDATVTGTPANFGYSYLSGAVKGDVPASWADYFALARSAFSDVLVVLSSSEAIHAEALAHVQEMENRKQKQVLFTGGDVGESITRVKQRAATLNSSRAVLCYPGIYHKSVGDGKKALPAYFTGAMVAGRVCGVESSEPITFDYFNLIGLEVDLIEGDPSIGDLINSGVCTLERVQNGAIRLVQGVTTYLGATDVVFKEISIRRGSDKVSSIMRKGLEDAFVGNKGLPATASAVVTKATDILDKAIDDDDITAYRNIVVKFDGDHVYVDYEVAYVEPINFVLLTSHFIQDTSITAISDTDQNAQV